MTRHLTYSRGQQAIHTFLLKGDPLGPGDTEEALASR